MPEKYQVYDKKGSSATQTILLYWYLKCFSYQLENLLLATSLHVEEKEEEEEKEDIKMTYLGQAARGRDARLSGANRKRQRTGNDFISQL